MYGASTSGPVTTCLQAIQLLRCILTLPGILLLAEGGLPYQPSRDAMNGLHMKRRFRVGADLLHTKGPRNPLCCHLTMD
jgi:hypothetical protein